MLKKGFFVGIGIFMIAALTLGVLPTATLAQQNMGGENFIFVNYFGQELYLDLDDVAYVVPGTATVPEGGRLALHLAPGEHKFAANVPGVPTGSAGEFVLEPGGFVAKAARVEQTGPTVEKGILIKKPEDYVFIFDFDPFAMPVEETTVVDTWQPSAITPGMGGIVWINHSGDDEMTIDLAGQIYKAPPQANDIPGRLQIELAPGFYRYTASVPYGSLNGEVTVVAGQITGLNIIPGQREAPVYDIGDFFEIPKSIDLSLFQEDLTLRTEAVQPSQPADSTPTTLPNTGGELAPAAIEAAPEVEGLLVKNYAGDVLIFTIDNQAYPIPQDAEAILPLAPGQYNYTASLPAVATTGVVDLAAGQRLGLSIAINVGGDVLSVYQN